VELKQEEQGRREEEIGIQGEMVLRGTKKSAKRAKWSQAKRQKTEES
jgi:hypothetical protein